CGGRISRKSEREAANYKPVLFRWPPYFSRRDATRMGRAAVQLRVSPGWDKASVLAAGGFLTTALPLMGGGLYQAGRLSNTCKS
ncbi:MAG: hypothetical protein ACK53L_19260, partial [Pirellulaceae bacterium]